MGNKKKDDGFTKTDARGVENDVLSPLIQGLRTDDEVEEEIRAWNEILERKN